MKLNENRELLNVDEKLNATGGGNNLMIAPIRIQEIKIDALYDTGASRTIIGKNSLDYIIKEAKLNCKMNEGKVKYFYTEGGKVKRLGTIELELEIVGKKLKWKFAVIPGNKVILGMDIMKKHYIKLDPAKMMIKRGRKKQSIYFINRDKTEIKDDELKIKSADDFILKARSICSVPVVADSHCTDALLCESDKPDLFPRAIIKVQGGVGRLIGINSTRSDILIQKGQVISIGIDLFDIIDELPMNKGQSGEQTSNFSNWFETSSEKELKEEINVVETTNTNDENKSEEDKTKEKELINIIKQKLEDTELNDKEKDELRNLILKYKEIFNNNLLEGGKVTKYPCKIKVKEDAQPVYTRRYNYSEKEHQIIDQEVEKLKKANIIEDSVSPWESPVVIVKKSDGSARFCIDFRRVNNLIEKDIYPLPNIDLALRGFSNCKYFTKMDFTSGFFQININPEDRPVTAFSTRHGKYQFKCLPQGFVNSSSIFQRSMNMILTGLSWQYLLVYIDDILIFSKSFDEHIQHLTNVFQKLKEHNLIVKISKCEFARSKLIFLGHVVSKEGLSVNPERTNVIKQCPVPTDHTGLRSFLGITGYYRKFIFKYTDETKPLRDVLNNKTWFWGDEQQKAFEKLKELLCSAPVLRHPDNSQPFEVLCDASGYAIGVVLQQNGHAISYYSQSLNKGEQNYGPSERECFALVTAVKKFRPFLYGHPFTVYTDHDSLRYLFNNRNHVGRLMRWSLQLQEYAQDMIIKYKPGKLHCAPDALSRYPMAHNGHRLKKWFKIYESKNKEYVNHLSDDESSNSSDESSNSDTEESEEEDPLLKRRNDFSNTPQDKVFKKRIEEDGEEISKEIMSDGEYTQFVDKLIQNERINNQNNNNNNIKENDETESEDEEWENKKFVELDEFGRLQAQDSEAGAIIRYKLYGKLPIENPDYILKISRECIIEDGRLWKIEWKRKDFNKTLWIPEEKIKDVIEYMHGSMLAGHSGFERTLLKVKERFHFEQMYSKVKKYVQECESCQKKKHLTRKPYHGEFMPLEHPSYPFERISMDIVGPLSTTERGNKYINCNGLFLSLARSRCYTRHECRNSSKSLLGQYNL
eukprot:TRINITY_DN1069_c0_g2_i14.p1 TRINITY_DN1069_c0_g2~~TRINITY_DN1069_c0_g2_i14.p1  ORF type:complete len:1095 (-),score=232.18 TRINITY_DN1069_c0_g2_i14:2084-5368(-)